MHAARELEEEEWHKVLLIDRRSCSKIAERTVPEDDDFKFQYANSGLEAGMLAGTSSPIRSSSTWAWAAAKPSRSSPAAVERPTPAR